MIPTSTLRGTFSACIAAAAFAALANAASAATTITVDSVVQRWPWNNKVDITYTVADGQDVARGVYRRIVFTAVIDGQTYAIDGTTDVGASADTGTHTVAWTAPAGHKSAGCTMSAAIYEAAVPSGDDYLVVDLLTGTATYEGLLATQADSNARYNDAAYKTDKLVLRKVPRTAESAALPNGPFAGGYPTGDSTNHGGSGDETHDAATWTTDRAYYVGVFPVTQHQYWRITGTNPAQKQDAGVGDEKVHRPVESVSWDDLRASTPSTSPLPTVDSDTGSFLQRLNRLAGNRFAFDLPTEVMFEIAERAGATTTYYWGNAMDMDYVVSSENSASCTVAVGSRLPNAWGLYDTTGNVREWCLDNWSDGNLTLRADAFTPPSQSSTARRTRGGGNFGYPSSDALFHASCRDNEGSDARSVGIGFRVSWIAD